MIEVRMERVINRYGNMGLKVREIRCPPKKALPTQYTDSTDVRCWRIECGSVPILAVAGVKGRHIPAPWDEDDEARQAYTLDSAYLQKGTQHGWPCVAAFLGLVYEAGCNLSEVRGTQDNWACKLSDLEQWKMELLMHLSPNKDGRFEEKDWKGYVTVKI